MSQYNFKTTLCKGREHSGTNAANLREWFAKVPEMAPQNRRAYVRDYEKRGFLTKRDADLLVAEFAP